MRSMLCSWLRARQAVKRFFGLGGEENVEEELRLVDAARARLLESPEVERDSVTQPLQQQLLIQLAAFLQKHPEAAPELQALVNRSEESGAGAGTRVTVHHTKGSQVLIAGHDVKAGNFTYRAPEGREVSDQSTPDPVPPLAPPAPAGAAEPAEHTGMSVDVHSVDRSQIIIAGRDVNLTGTPPLPVDDIPEAELDVVRRAWVSMGLGEGAVTTAADAVSLLASDGPALAVIAGPSGYGKRTAGIRALWEVSQAERTGGGAPLALAEIRPDGDKPEAPDISSLPKQPGTGYLLDAAAEINGWEKPTRSPGHW
ncbi:hypothetical protein HHL19_01420 [Streptomyces sp. R302]|uniref:hypothetical protein n=1 Tax=unclassified Streptomyces TaxID=2593676 RepID=UPI00145FA847|nr:MULTISPECIES: hypothetical protein [unclassified Streptomyces]NML49026.1 hypothetical protein [Streptomyces sp. R301]NML77353.1 hypothetical protein [Streptomyces sp. R302]